MSKRRTLLEGKKRVVAEIQVLYQNMTGKYLSQKNAKETFEKIFDIIFDEIFQFGKFVFPKGYGQIYIRRRRRKLFLDREYKVYEPNYEDETGSYYITFVVRFQPGAKTKERLRQYSGKAMGAKTTPVDDDFMKVLTYFTENNDVE